MRETLSQMEGHIDQSLANSLFPVYLNLQAIRKAKAFLQKRSVGLAELLSFRSFWFKKKKSNFYHASI